jgi:hypothetical protein
MVKAMANNPFSLDEEFDSVLLEDRKDIVGRFEALALAYGDYSSRPNNRWLRSLPVVLALHHRMSLMTWIEIFWNLQFHVQV